MTNEQDMVPLADLGRLNQEEYANYCADLCERVLSDEMTWDDAANLLFGPEPDYTFVRTI